MENEVNNYIFILISIVSVLVIVNQVLISSLGSFVGSGSSTFSSMDLEDVKIEEIQSTAQAIALLFPVNKIKTEEDAIKIMIPTGTPDYGNSMGVSFDDPVIALTKLERAYPALKQQAKQDPKLWQRYLNLAAKPTGISCEFCCGIGAQGIDSKGELRCGCSHNPGVHSVTLWLMKNTDYTDAEILKEVMKWKTIWFPRDMTKLALELAGKDASEIKNLPGMVGGC